MKSLVAFLTSDSGLRVALAFGWLAQAGTWLAALARVGRAAAAPGEWGPELGVRSGVVALVGSSLVLSRGDIVPLGPAATLGALATFLIGHAVAVAGRVQLGASWGIGTRPRPGRASVVRSGIYRVVSHPIYWGTGVAAAMQVLLLQNLPACLLLAGAALINPFKIARENRWTRAAASGR